MRCVHGVRIDKPCADCEYEHDCRQRGVPPQNRWEDSPMNPANHGKGCRCIGCQRLGTTANNGSDK